MNAMRLLYVAISSIVVTTMWLQFKRIDDLNSLVDMHEKTYAELQLSIDTMAEANRHNNEVFAKVLLSQQQIQQNLSARQNEIRRLQTHVEEIRAWADTTLPFDIVRLRKRPAITGADGFSASMSTSDTLHIDGSKPTD